VCIFVIAIIFTAPQGFSNVRSLSFYLINYLNYCGFTFP